MALIEVNGIKVYCLKCKTEDIMRHGHNHQGKQCYYCKKCRFKFIAHFDRKKPFRCVLTDAQKTKKKHQYYLKNKDKWRKYREIARAKGFKPKSRKRRYISLKLLFGTPINVDSLVGIPCFGCYQYDCEPKSCGKLTDYLERS